jgi:hypothetical protein
MPSPIAVALSGVIWSMMGRSRRRRPASTGVRGSLVCARSENVTSAIESPSVSASRAACAAARAWTILSPHMEPELSMTSASATGARLAAIALG